MTVKVVGLHREVTFMPCSMAFSTIRSSISRGVRVLKVYDGLTFEADKPFDMSVLHHSTEQIYKATHTDELVRSDKTFVHIDYKMSGLGTNGCGPELKECYRLSEKKIIFNFTCAPTKL